MSSLFSNSQLPPHHRGRFRTTPDSPITLFGLRTVTVGCNGFKVPSAAGNNSSAIFIEWTIHFQRGFHDRSASSEQFKAVTQRARRSLGIFLSRQFNFPYEGVPFTGERSLKFLSNCGPCQSAECNGPPRARECAPGEEPQLRQDKVIMHLRRFVYGSPNMTAFVALPRNGHFHPFRNHNINS